MKTHPRSSALSLTVRQLQALSVARRQPTSAIAIARLFERRYGPWSRNGLYTTLNRLARRGLLRPTGASRTSRKWALTTPGLRHRRLAHSSLK